MMNDEKSEIPISKFETISKSQIHRFKIASVLGPTEHRPGFEFCALVIGICFGFRILDLEFASPIIHRFLLALVAWTENTQILKTVNSRPMPITPVETQRILANHLDPQHLKIR
jgi:hypothetical protein